MANNNLVQRCEIGPTASEDYIRALVGEKFKVLLPQNICFLFVLSTTNQKGVTPMLDILKPANSTTGISSHDLIRCVLQLIKFYILFSSTLPLHFRACHQALPHHAQAKFWGSHLLYIARGEGEPDVPVEFNAQTKQTEHDSTKPDDTASTTKDTHSEATRKVHMLYYQLSC